MKRFLRTKYVAMVFVCAVSILLLPLGQVAKAQPTVDSIYDIQSTVDAEGASLYQFADVTIQGIVTATSFEGYVVAEAPGAWNAIYVASWFESVSVGDEVRLTGWVYEYYGLTVIFDVVDFELLSSGNPVEPAIVSVAEASQEAYESVLITVEDVEVAALLDYGEWVVTDVPPTAGLLCDDLNDYVYFPAMGDRLDSLTGILTFAFGDFKLEPRATQDITGAPIPHYALHGTVVTMNDARDVFLSAYVEILGDQIVAIQRRRPRDIPVVQTNGLIFPGLIDSHNHPYYNVLHTIPFGRLYAERYEWQHDPLYDSFYDQLYAIYDYGGLDVQELNILKYGEVRALTAGTTSIQGLNGYYYPEVAHQGIVIDNIERYPGMVLDSVFPLRVAEEEWLATAEENWSRFMIHLSEGTSPAVLEEFYVWQGWGMLDARTTIIHGIPYGAPEWTAMAEAGASLVWSPVSNMALYGATAQIPGALAAGVNVALAPDWTPSGSLDILDEMKEANRINREQWGGAITPLQFAEFVTRNAAQAAGIEGFVGQIAPGYRANLTVIRGSRARPYDTLLRADQADVRLVVVDGKPMYGDPWLLKRFDFVDNVEYVLVDGRIKGLAIQVDAHAIPESDKPFMEIQTELAEAYAAAEPKVCAFAGLDSAGLPPTFWFRPWSAEWPQLEPSAETLAGSRENGRVAPGQFWLPADCIESSGIDPTEQIGLGHSRLPCLAP